MEALTQRCNECGGRGYGEKDNGEEVRCGVCNGRGKVLTPAGEAIIAVVRDFLGEEMFSKAAPAYRLEFGGWNNPRNEDLTDLTGYVPWGCLPIDAQGQRFGTIQEGMDYLDSHYTPGSNELGISPIFRIVATNG